MTGTCITAWLRSGCSLFLQSIMHVLERPVEQPRLCPHKQLLMLRGEGVMFSDCDDQWQAETDVTKGHPDLSQADKEEVINLWTIIQANGSRYLLLTHFMHWVLRIISTQIPLRKSKLCMFLSISLHNHFSCSVLLWQPLLCCPTLTISLPTGAPHVTEETDWNGQRNEMTICNRWFIQKLYGQY